MTHGERIDWEALAKVVGSIQQDCERGGDGLARAALGEILGSNEIVAAVDFYVSGRPGAELARSVLRILKPWPAMSRCREIYETSPNLDARRVAIELLRVVADRRVLPWIPSFLRDADEGIQAWGAGIVDQLLWCELVTPAECTELFNEMTNHANEAVRETASFIQSFLAGREKRIRDRKERRDRDRNS